jgi:hypothetical protein
MNGVNDVFHGLMDNIDYVNVDLDVNNTFCFTQSDFSDLPTIEIIHEVDTSIIELSTDACTCMCICSTDNTCTCVYKCVLDLPIDYVHDMCNHVSNHMCVCVCDDIINDV